MKGLDGLEEFHSSMVCSFLATLSRVSRPLAPPASHRNWMYCDVDDGFSVWLFFLFIFARGRIWFLEFFLHFVERTATCEAVTGGVRRTFGTACFSLNDATSGRVVFLALETRRCLEGIWSGYHVPTPRRLDSRSTSLTRLKLASSSFSRRTQGPFDRNAMRGIATDMAPSR